MSGSDPAATQAIDFQRWAQSNAPHVHTVLGATHAQPALADVMRESVTPPEEGLKVSWQAMRVASEISTFPGIQSGKVWGFILTPEQGMLRDWDGPTVGPRSYGESFEAPVGAHAPKGTERALVVLGGNTRLDALRILLGGLYWHAPASAERLSFRFAPYRSESSYDPVGPAGGSGVLYAIRTPKGDLIGTRGDILLDYWYRGSLRDLYAASYEVVYSTLDEDVAHVYNGEAGRYPLGAMRDSVFDEAIELAGGVQITGPVALREIGAGARAGRVLLQDPSYARAAAAARSAKDMAAAVRMRADPTTTVLFERSYPTWLHDYVSGLYPTVTVAGYLHLNRAFLYIAIAMAGSEQRTYLLPLPGGSFDSEDLRAALGELIGSVGAAIIGTMEQAIYAALFFPNGAQPDETWTAAGRPQWRVYADLSARRYDGGRGPYAVQQSWEANTLPISAWVAKATPEYRSIGAAFDAPRGPTENLKIHREVVPGRKSELEPEAAAPEAPAPAPVTVPEARIFTEKELRQLASGTVLLSADGFPWVKVDPLNFQRFRLNSRGDAGPHGVLQSTTSATMLKNAWVLLKPGPFGKKKLKTTRDYQIVWDSLELRERSPEELRELFQPRVLRGFIQAVVEAAERRIRDADREELEVLGSELRAQQYADPDRLDEIIDALWAELGQAKYTDADVFTPAVRDEIVAQANRMVVTGPVLVQFNARAEELGVEPVAEQIDYEGLEREGQAGLFGSYKALKERKRTPTADWVARGGKVTPRAAIVESPKASAPKAKTPTPKQPSKASGPVVTPVESAVKGDYVQITYQGETVVGQVKNARPDRLTVDITGAHSDEDVGLVDVVRTPVKVPTPKTRGPSKAPSFERAPEEEIRQPVDADDLKPVPAPADFGASTREGDIEVSPGVAYRSYLTERLGLLGWSITAQFDDTGKATTTDYMVSRAVLHNRYTGEEAEIVRTAESGKDGATEDNYVFRARVGWNERSVAALNHLATLTSPQAPTVNGYSAAELVPGDVVVGLYASEVRVFSVSPEHKLRVIASSDTFRGQRYIQAKGGGPSAAAPDMTPAKIEAQPGLVVASALAAIGIVPPRGTRVFMQIRGSSSLGDWGFSFRGRIGESKDAGLARPDPWEAPLSPTEEIQATADWQALGGIREPIWLGSLGARLSKWADSGAISRATGDVLRARGVEATTRLERGHVTLSFPSAQRAALLRIVAPDDVSADTATFMAVAARKGSPYGDLGGAQIEPDYIQEFAKAYVTAAHEFASRGKFRSAGEIPALSRYIWQKLADRRAADPVSSGDGEAAPQSSRAGEKRATWTSPKYGPVEVIEAAKGKWGAEWNNINAKGVRYGYNGKRWSRVGPPPADLMAEVVENGWGTLFGSAS